MKLRIFQKGFNYMQDGPGNRLVYHLCGCNMHCPWCSNPEGMAKSTALSKEYEISALVAEAVSCRPMFFDGGGVTLTGGEVCVQAQAACELLEELRKNGIGTAVETNASLPGFREMLPYVSHLMTDFKHYDNAKLREVTGVGNESIIGNLRFAAESGAHPHIRIPLIRGFNASLSDVDGFVGFFVSLGGEFDVELLAYHEYGRDKWRELGKEYTVNDGFVTPELFDSFASAFRDAGIKLIKT